MSNIAPLEMNLDELRDALAPRVAGHAAFDGWSVRALAILAQPQNLPLAARLGWRAADRMWRIAGDKATDYNHYSKRAILMAVYGSTSLVYLDDRSGDLAETRAFLDRRIDDVMRFEKLKASWRGNRDRLPSISRFLGRLRYPTA